MILHLDMDAFYASVEQLDNPALRGKPVIVGNASERGVVSTASYEARRFGVHSAMPMVEAKKKCPLGVFVRGRMDRYKAVSAQVMAILHDFSPAVEPVSIDEAYIDIHGSERIFGEPHTLGAAVKKRIRDDVHLPCSVGIAPLKILSKIASDMNKPDGLTVIMPEDTHRFIETLPVYRIPGVGKRMAGLLDSLGIRLLGDVKNYSEAVLVQRLGRYGIRLARLSRGIDDSTVTPLHASKSFSSEHTFSKDIHDLEPLKTFLLHHADAVGRQLRKHSVRAKIITLKIKTFDFALSTRRMTLKAPTQSSDVIFNAAVALLGRYSPRKAVRLIGVGASGLTSADGPVQMDLFSTGGSTSDEWEKVDRAIDGIAEKFGRYAVKRASVYRPDK